MTTTGSEPQDAAPPSPELSPGAHSVFVRLAHWVNAFAILVMILSGWRIYDADPFLGFSIPRDFTLGGWLAGALAWHFAAMWLLVANGLAYLVYALASGHWRDLAPTGGLWRDLAAALAGMLDHVPGRYNAVQRWLYLFAMGCIILAVVSGVAIWKPVQFQELTSVLGGYEGARRWHFAAMTGLVAFLIVHVAAALSAPHVLKAMIRGRAGQTP